MAPPSIAGYNLNSTQVSPVAWITSAYMKWKDIIINEITNEVGYVLSTEQHTIITTSGRADKFLALIRMAPSVSNTPEGRNALKALYAVVNAWLLLPRDGESIRRVKFEAEPVFYVGPIITRIKDGHVTMKGDQVEGRLQHWLVHNDGTGNCLLEITGGKACWLAFTVDDMVSHPELVTFLEIDRTRPYNRMREFLF